MLRYGLSSYSFRWAVGTPAFRPSRPLTPFDLVEQTAALGCDLLQIADNHDLDDYGAERLADLRSLAQARRVTLEIGASGAIEPKLRRYLGMAEALDARLVRLVLDGPDTHPGLDEAERLLRRMAPAYRQAGVALAIENHFLIPSRELAALVQRVGDPAVGVCLDFANSIASCEWPRETVALLAPLALNVHLKDFTIAPHPEGVGVVVSGAPLGEGEQDVPALLAAIPDRGRLHFILEQWLPRRESEEATLALEREWIVRSLAAARRLLGEDAPGTATVSAWA